LPAVATVVSSAQSVPIPLDNVALFLFNVHIDYRAVSVKKHMRYSLRALHKGFTLIELMVVLVIIRRARRAIGRA
jgi:hypothetical protein